MKLLLSKRWHVGLLLVVIIVAAGYWVHSLNNAQAASAAPQVKGIPGESIVEGGTFASVDLLKYVTDEDSDINKITWKTSGEVDLTVVITDAIAEITYPARWTGSETITFTATDDLENTGSGDATFTVTAASEPPVVSDIPKQTITTASVFTLISLDTYVADADTADDAITWTATGQVECTAKITLSRTVRVQCPVEWTGTETITFTATDPEGNFDSDSATFTVTAVQYSPVVTDIPDQSVTVGTAFELISLDSYVSDTDTADSELTWTNTGQSECTVTIDAEARTALVACPDAWIGAETITFTATDPEEHTDSDSAVFTAESVPEADVVAPEPAAPAATNQGAPLPLPTVGTGRLESFPVPEKNVVEASSGVGKVVDQQDKTIDEKKVAQDKEELITALQGGAVAVNNPTISKLLQIITSSAVVEPVRSEIVDPKTVDVQKLESLPLVEQPKNGRANSEAVVVQERLKGYGFVSNQVPAAVSFDPATQAAVKDFQSTVGINPIGIVGPRTTKALNGQEFISNVAYVFTSIIMQGERGEDVRQLQTRLRDQGFFPPNVPSTGWYGPITRAAVETFQKVYALPITGLIDEATRALLNIFSRPA